MNLSSLQLHRLGSAVRFSATVHSESLGEREIWYSVPVDYADAIAADRFDAFLVALLPLAVTRRESLRVEGAVSTRLLHHVRHTVLPLLKLLYHDSEMQVQASETIASRETPSAVATGFSAGIDSFATLCDHFVRETTPGYRITHLLFNNVGAHGFRDLKAASALFHARYQRASGFAAELGLPMIPVDTNLHAFLPAGFQKAHTLMNVSVALLLQSLVRVFYYSSCYHYRHCAVTRDTKDVAYADPMLVPLLSTESLECISTGSHYTRVDKTRLVSDYAPSWDWLSVCINPEAEGRNCSTCSKCCRTLLTLELLGVADRYARLFDLNAFASVRGAYVRDHVLPSSPGSFEFEIREAMESEDSSSVSGATVDRTR